MRLAKTKRDNEGPWDALVRKVGFHAAKAGESVDLLRVRAVVKSFVCLLGDQLVLHDEVHVPALGTFRVGQRAARRIKNPNTGEWLELPALAEVRFRAAKSLQRAVRR